MQRVKALASGWKARPAAIETRTAGLEGLRAFLLDGSADAAFAAGRIAIPNAMTAVAGGANVIQTSGQWAMVPVLPGSTWQAPSTHGLVRLSLSGDAIPRYSTGKRVANSRIRSAVFARQSVPSTTASLLQAKPKPGTRPVCVHDSLALQAAIANRAEVERLHVRLRDKGSVSFRKHAYLARRDSLQETGLQLATARFPTGNPQPRKPMFLLRVKYATVTNARGWTQTKDV